MSQADNEKSDKSIVFSTPPELNKDIQLQEKVKPSAKVVTTSLLPMVGAEKSNLDELILSSSSPILPKARPIWTKQQLLEIGEISKCEESNRLKRDGSNYGQNPKIDSDCSVLSRLSPTNNQASQSKPRSKTKSTPFKLLSAKNKGKCSLKSLPSKMNGKSQKTPMKPIKSVVSPKENEPSPQKSQNGESSCLDKLFNSLFSNIHDYREFQEGCRQILQMCTPIFICLILVLVGTSNLDYVRSTFISFQSFNLLPMDDIDLTFDTASAIGSEVDPSLMPTREELDGGYANKIWFIVGTVAVLFIMIIVVTCLMLAFFRRGLMRFMSWFYIFAFGLVLSLFPLLFVQEMLFTCNIAADWPMVVLAIYNFAALGLMVFFGGGPKRVRQGYCVIFCTFMSLYIIKMLNLAMTIVLLALMCLWDIYAVLSQKGKIPIWLNNIRV